MKIMCSSCFSWFKNCKNNHKKEKYYIFSRKDIKFSIDKKTKICDIEITVKNIGNSSNGHK
jgi:hypothetical protein